MLLLKANRSVFGEGLFLEQTFAWSSTMVCGAGLFLWSSMAQTGLHTIQIRNMTWITPNIQLLNNCPIHSGAHKFFH